MQSPATMNLKVSVDCNQNLKLTLRVGIFSNQWLQQYSKVVADCNQKFDGTIYTIRYFQHDGKGSLRMENGTVFQPNDRYLLENEKFRLYYTSASTETQTLTVVVEDNFGKSYEMEFSFNDTDEEEEFARSANKLGRV